MSVPEFRCEDAKMISRDNAPREAEPIGAATR